MVTKIKDDLKFVKSSFSPKYDSPRCVSVSIQEHQVLVINTNEQSAVLSFSHEEWLAFIKGVKAGEFDI